MARLRVGVIVMYAGMFVYVVLYSVYCRLFLFWKMFLLFDMEMNASYISQNRASLRQFVTVFRPVFLYSSWYYERKHCGKLRNEMKTAESCWLPGPEFHDSQRTAVLVAHFS